MKLDWNKLGVRERDAVVVEKALGFKWVPSVMELASKSFFIHSTEGVYIHERDNYIKPCRPTQNIQDAWLVVERMKELGFQLQLFAPITTNGQWTAKFMCHKSGKLHFGFGPTAPEAICLAALRAEGVEV